MERGNIFSLQQNTREFLRRVLEGTTESMRLQKYLARAGVGSRRACEGYIIAGRVTVNGQIAVELGTCVDLDADTVSFDGSVVVPVEADTTIMLHKPAGYVTTMSDPQGRHCVAELVPVDRYPSLFPVGRLDRDTTGLLLFTTDGSLGNGLIHPRQHVRKTYLALVEGLPEQESIHRLRNGILMDGSLTQPARVRVLQGAEKDHALDEIGFGVHSSGMGQRHTGKRSRNALSKNASILEVGVCEGRNRQVRRMLSAVGHEVIALHRRELAGLYLGGLERGKWRMLSAEEVKAIRKAAGM